MRLSLNWLQECFSNQASLDWQNIFNNLNLRGIEQSIHINKSNDSDKIVVAQILSCEQHPNADKLKICSVDIGSNIVQIICGANNVTAGIKVPCATVGSTLPNGLTIEPRKMRGEYSYGMLCSATEIGLTGAEGLLILNEQSIVGAPIKQSIASDEQIIDFEITPNRGDCLSLLGICREISSITGIEHSVCHTYNSYVSLASELIIDIQQVSCNYYAAMINDIVTMTTPDFIANRLTTSSINLVSPIVDILNYIMIEIGHPLHAFDADKVGKIGVRYAQNDETILLLNGRLVQLDSNTIIVVNSENHPIAIAGVMGSMDSSITKDTKNIIIESAFYVPQDLHGIAKKYGIISEAAYRFERGVDHGLTKHAINYAILMINKYFQGKLVGFDHRICIQETSNKSFYVSEVEFTNLIGISISNAKIESLLRSVGFHVTHITNEHKLLVSPPSHRFDILTPQDIIAEIARLYGFNNIEAAVPIQEITSEYNDEHVRLMRLKTTLIAMGFHETISYAFIEPKDKIFNKKNALELNINNAIAGLSCLRTSLISNLINNLIYNIRYGFSDIKLFEIANVFHGVSDLKQPTYLSGIVYGNFEHSNWASKGRDNDLFDIKNVVENCIGHIKFVELNEQSDYIDVLHAGCSASIIHNNQIIGVAGKLHPRLVKLLKLQKAPYLFDINLDYVLQCRVRVVARPISNCPRVLRDIVFVMQKDIQVADIVNIIQIASIKHLVDLDVFDVYLCNDFGEDKKSIAFSCTFQADNTLTDNEVNTSVNCIIDAVCNNFAAVHRS